MNLIECCEYTILFEIELKIIECDRGEREAFLIDDQQTRNAL